MIIRETRPADHPAVDALLEEAFGGRAEADLVRQLRPRDAEIELVAEEADLVVGHVMFSRLDAPLPALALAPLAVTEARRRQGIGSALVAAGHDRARRAGWQAVFVVGDPAYYMRLGYDPALAGRFDSPYAGPHFMMRQLDRDIQASGGAIRYAPAFQALEE